MRAAAPAAASSPVPSCSLFLRAASLLMQELKTRRSGLKAWPVLGITFIQALLLLAHWFIYRTWIVFWWPLSPAAALALRVALFLLSFSFIAAALLGFYFANRLVTFLYKLAAVWLGLLNFFFLAACLCRLAWVRFSPCGAATRPAPNRRRPLCPGGSHQHLRPAQCPPGAHPARLHPTAQPA